VNSVFQKTSAFLAISACLFASLAGAQSTSSFPQMPVDAKTERVRNQANEVYERTDYDRAFFIYRNELAPIGDKYAQYMVGFMYLTGKGVAEDRVTASAWYRLAAERDTQEFMRVRDQVMATFDAAQRAESDRQFVALRKQYGDLVLLVTAIRQDYEELRSRTGSRLNSSTSSVTVVELNAGASTSSGSDYFGRIERRMKSRLEYIARHTEIEIIDFDVDNANLEFIEEQIALSLSRVD
jgi:hypothetical protein